MSGLEVRNLTVRYGPTTVVHDLGLDVERGQIVGLIGPNGAGKTTSIDAITGFVPAKGTIRFGGDDVTSAPAHRRARLGLGRTWQSLELFDDLTIRDNLRIAADHESVTAAIRRLVRRRARHDDAVDEAMERLGIAALAERYPTEVSQGQRKLVSSARALAARPSVVCMDEPAAGLDSAESLELGRRLRSVAADDVGILLVDHDMGLVLEVCDTIVVIDFGSVIATGTPAEIRSNRDVLEAYLGAAVRHEEER